MMKLVVSRGEPCCFHSRQLEFWLNDVTDAGTIYFLNQMSLLGDGLHAVFGARINNQFVLLMSVLRFALTLYALIKMSYRYS